MAIRGKHHGRPGTPELAVTAKDQTLVLDVTVPDHGSSDLTGIEYRYKETTGSLHRGPPVTEAISNSGGTFEIGGLTNGTEYTVQVQTVNDIGTSEGPRTRTPRRPTRRRQSQWSPSPRTRAPTRPTPSATTSSSR